MDGNFPKIKYHLRGGGSILVTSAVQEKALGDEWIDNKLIMEEEDAEGILRLGRTSTGSEPGTSSGIDGDGTSSAGSSGTSDGTEQQPRKRGRKPGRKPAIPELAN